MRKVLVLLLLSTVALASAGAASGARAQQSVSAWDKQWLMTSIAGDRFEIAGGQLALRQSQDPAVQRLARRLIRDHSKSLQETTKLANSLGITPPSQPQPSMQWELQAVSQFSGGSFDRNYTRLEVFDHRQDISEARDAWTDGTNPQVRAEAKKEIPVLRVHLALARLAENTTS
jgi:putative membrane protein